MIDAAISESMFNMLEGCIPELVRFGYCRQPSGSTITGACPLSPQSPSCVSFGFGQ